LYRVQFCMQAKSICLAEGTCGGGGSAPGAGALYASGPMIAPPPCMPAPRLCIMHWLCSGVPRAKLRSHCCAAHAGAFCCACPCSGTISNSAIISRFMFDSPVLSRLAGRVKAAFFAISHQAYAVPLVLLPLYPAGKQMLQLCVVVCNTGSAQIYHFSISSSSDHGRTLRFRQ
jgi:hypothetical protein